MPNGVIFNHKEEWNSSLWQMELEVEEKLFIIDFLKFIANIIEKGSIITLLRKGIGPGDLHCLGQLYTGRKWKGIHSGKEVILSFFVDGMAAYIENPMIFLTYC